MGKWIKVEGKTMYRRIERREIFHERIKYRGGTYRAIYCCFHVILSLRLYKEVNYAIWLQDHSIVTFFLGISY